MEDNPQIPATCPCENQIDFRRKRQTSTLNSCTTIPSMQIQWLYTLSHLENDRDVTSARIPEEDACHRACNLCVFACVQKGTQRLTHKGCVLQRVFLDAISDVTVVLGMRQSIDITISLSSP